MPALSFNLLEELRLGCESSSINRGGETGFSSCRRRRSKNASEGICGRAVCVVSEAVYDPNRKSRTINLPALGNLISSLSGCDWGTDAIKKTKKTKHI
jgi:hypothetical protein